MSRSERRFRDFGFRALVGVLGLLGFFQGSKSVEGCRLWTFRALGFCTVCAPLLFFVGVERGVLRDPAGVLAPELSGHRKFRGWGSWV